VGRAGPRARRNIVWIEKYCRYPDGKLVGREVRLTSEQKRWMRRIYDSPTRTFILSMARKNAKTAFIAMLLLLHLVGPEARQNSQLFSDAQSREQAAILFAYAAKMVRMSPDLAMYVTIRDSTKQLFCEQLGTLYRALSAEASTAYGFNPAFAVHDELGQVIGPRSDLYEALETAAGAQEEPLSIVISTQAPNDADLLSMLIDDALAGNDPRVKVELYTAPVDLDPFTDVAIRAANPHFDVFMNKEEVRSQAEAARRMPSREAAYRNLVLNQRVTLSNPFVARSVWEQGNAPIDEAAFRENQVFIGLDLSARIDLCAMAAIAEGDDGFWNAKFWFWTPRDTLAERAKRDRAPYDVWQREGLLIATPGKSVEYGLVCEALLGVVDDCDVASIGFDRWRIDVLKAELARADRDDLPLEPVGQGFKDMTPALETLESVLLSGKLRHGGHPIARYCAFNAVATRDPAGGRKLDKSKTTARIDGMSALANAFARAGIGAEGGKSFWEQAA
jgi:phage terminase large subunit-like protein